MMDNLQVSISVSGRARSGYTAVYAKVVEALTAAGIEVQHAEPLGKELVDSYVGNDIKPMEFPVLVNLVCLNTEDRFGKEAI